MNATAQALSLAIAKAAMQGDRNTVQRLLAAAHDASRGGDSQTFADSTQKRGWNMKQFINWLTGRKDTEQKHREEHERQRQAFRPDEVLPAETLSETEQRVYRGDLIYMASSNVHTVRYDRGDERGGHTRLFVTFKDGSVYQYSDVPFDVVMREIQSDSPGREIWRSFRSGTPPYKSLYNGRKIGEVSLTKKEQKPTVVHVLSYGTKNKR